MSYYNKLVTILEAQATILKELNGEVCHSKLKSFTDNLVGEFQGLGLDLKDEAKKALFRVENLHSIKVD